MLSMMLWDHIGGTPNQALGLEMMTCKLSLERQPDHKQAEAKGPLIYTESSKV